MSKKFKFGISGALVIIIILAISMWRFSWVLADATHVTHKPVTGSALISYGGTGLRFKPMHQPWSPFGVISELRAIHDTDETLKLFAGKPPRNVELYAVSKLTGSDGASYEFVNPALTKGDPSFTKTHNHWQNIPCYLITFQSKASLTSGGAAPPPGTKAQPLHFGPSQVVVLVDAANGMVLLSFAITPDE